MQAVRILTRPEKDGELILKDPSVRRGVPVEVIILSIREGETEATLIADWLGASLPSLREVWDNEEDAIYDQL
jgi:uncharacterized protein (DUF433 family)